MTMRSMAKLFAVSALVGALTSAVQAQTVVTWDGGTADFAAAKWNGGQTATAVFGDNRISNGAFDITIGGGSTVTYAAGPGGTGNAIRPRSNTGPTIMRIIEGSTFHQTTIAAGDADGMWTTFDADLVLDNGTFKRDWEAGGNAQAGGILMIGSWRSIKDQQIDISITNGGKIDNDGQVWFGADEEHARGLKVYMTINNGSLDLTGGDNYPTSNDSNQVLSDLAFWYGHDVFRNNAEQGLSMDGMPKNEEYRINFKGPGSITVDTGGISVYDQDAASIWTELDASYEDLWNRGILRSDGVSGGYLDPDTRMFVSTGRAFTNFFTVTGTKGMDNYKVTRKDPTVVTWDGGTGEWNDDAKWNTGQTAAAVMGANQAGTMNRGSDGGHAVVIDGSKPGGADVSFDPNPGTGAGTDFRMRVDNGVSSLTIKNGGKFRIHSASDVDGKWTRQGSSLTIEGAGSLYSRTKDGVNSQSGGVLLFGAFNQQQGQEIDVNIRDGGRLENDGQVWFGTDNSSNGLTVNMTIDGGSVDLTGGQNYPLDLSVLGIDPDLAFFYAYRNSGGGAGPIGPANEKYSINFTGPGTFTVDHSGIYVVKETAPDVFEASAKTYEQLWADGILQANGLSGKTGATFSNFFSVTGTHLMDNYTLTSLIGATTLAGDYNSDGAVNAADYVVWRNGDSPDDTQAGYDLWKGNFGRTAAAGAALGNASAAVPEPGTLALLALACGAALWRRRS